MTARTTWSPPPVWSVPRIWENDRCFVICGGESIREQRSLIPQLRGRGRVIAVKEAVLLEPNADVAFFSGEHMDVIAPPLLRRYSGELVVVRGKGHPVFPATAKRIGRTETHEAWSWDPTKVAGFDSGTSAINLAILFGASEIVVLGYDMAGGRWFAGEHPHPVPVIPPIDFIRHTAPLPALSAGAAANGIRIVNVSPTSRVTAFEREQLEAFL